MPQHPPQRFNHVAMTVPAELLDETGRAELLHFYGEVFGWTEMPTLTEDRKRLVLRAHSNEQFVFLVAGDRPMRTSASDHFGLSVDTPEQLDAMLERSRRLARDDARVVIVDKTVEEFHGVLTLHGFYVGFRLPLQVEVQCYDWAAGVGPESVR